MTLIRSCLLLLCCGISVVLWAQSDPFLDGTFSDTITTEAAPIADSLQHEWSWSADILLFSRTNEFAKKVGTINPDNRVAELSDYDMGLYLRPKLRYQLNKDRELFGLWVQPRLNMEVDLSNATLTEDDYDMEFYFQELKAKFQINKSLYVMGGRYLKEMGTSIFINPSNPFILDPGRINPKIEQRPMDFVELNYSTEKSWEFALFANVYKGENFHYDFPYFDFERSYGLLADYYGDALNIGLVSMFDEGGKVHLGSNGQANLTEALVVYNDLAFIRKPNRFYPVNGHWTDPQLLEYDMINGSKNDQFFFHGLVGLSYTTLLGPTVSLEYYYNGLGYDEEEAELLQEQIAHSSTYNFDVTKDLANINLARSINPGILYNRRHYLFSSIGDTDVWGQLDYNLRYVASFEDQSHQLSALTEWRFGNFEAFAVLLFNFGGRDTDLNRLLDRVAMLGVIYRM